MNTPNVLKVALVFLNGFAGLIAAYPGPELGALERLICAALVAGCGAALLVLNPPGRSKSVDPDDLTPAQRRKLVAAVKAEMMATPAKMSDEEIVRRHGEIG